ncbi:efflux RND transporter permease subunit [Parasediminibacterium sp. JCM 36343]|uniref:efflux RND transporter permease subunit n=1 Tax=Parasediminibacterium sp. JCM 36343 TaxID=3374279 RepID=UPI00397A70A2
MLVLLMAVNAFAVYKAIHVKISYDFSRAIPTDNPKYIDFQAFKQKFGEDVGTVVVGIESKDFFTPKTFNAVAKLQQNLKKVPDVNDVLSVPDALNILNDTLAKKFRTKHIFQNSYTSPAALDIDRRVFENLPFYRGLLYNPATNCYLVGISVNKDTINSKSRTRLIQSVLQPIHDFEKESGITVHISGLPYLRTIIGDRIKAEMNYFILGSFLLSAFTLFLFFRSISATIMSLLVVGMGVVWSLATMVLCGYNITLLTALIPPLIVVIGIPNCIYFLNKYHTAYEDTGDKMEALKVMVGRMGIVTLFCNIAAAIGFAVFAFTRSNLLREFGVVSGINIMLLFVISLVFIPSVLSYLPPPKAKHVKYLNNPFLEQVLVRIECWVFAHAKWVYVVTITITLFSIAGIFRLKSEGFIVDDLPKKDKIYTDLKWFESNFEGVMPLEIMVDTKKKKGLIRNTRPLAKIDEFSQYINDKPETGRPLSFVEGLKFAKQAYFDGDTLSYNVPADVDMAFLGSYLNAKSDSSGKPANNNAALKLMSRFIDSNKQVARISVNMKDIGSRQLPIFLQDLENKSHEIFDTAAYKVTFTGSSVTFLEGSSFIIKGLRDSICWAFLLITLCMLYLFRSFRIVVCSLIPNVIPLVITAGVMGWVGITLKPSTVLVFSIALGIAIDVTIRFLINYKQELPHYKEEVAPTLVQTIKHTGISIIYTSLVLIAGFIIFCFSSFGGTIALGWLTSLTLVAGTLTNLVLLPVLIMSMAKKK